MPDESDQTEALLDLWPPAYTLFLRDEKLDIEIPITIFLDEPLSFDIKPDMVLTESQAVEILEKSDVQTQGSPVAGTETYPTIIDLVTALAQRPMDDWFEDEDEARRLGRLIAIASYFEPLVQAWLGYWHTVLGEAGKVRGWDSREESEASDDRGITSSVIEQIAQAVYALHEPDISMIARRTEDISHSNTKLLEKAESLDLLTQLRYNLKEVAKILRMTPKTLRDNDLLNNLNENEFCASKLNGRKKRKKGKTAKAKAIWEFRRSEVRRFGRLDISLS